MACCRGRALRLVPLFGQVALPQPPAMPPAMPASNLKPALPPFPPVPHLPPFPVPAPAPAPAATAAAPRSVGGAPPESLVRRWVRIYWPDDEEWYEGEVREYRSATGEHRVWYPEDDQVGR